MDFDESIAYETIITKTYDQEMDVDSSKLSSTTEKAFIDNDEKIFIEKQKNSDEGSNDKLNQPVSSSSTPMSNFSLIQVFLFFSICSFRFFL